MEGFLSRCSKGARTPWSLISPILALLSSGISISKAQVFYLSNSIPRAAERMNENPPSLSTEKLVFRLNFRLFIQEGMALKGGRLTDLASLCGWPMVTKPQAQRWERDKARSEDTVPESRKATVPKKKEIWILKIRDRESLGPQRR
jgi:hypothetical protein